MAVIHFVVLDAFGLDHAARFEDFTNRADTITMKVGTLQITGLSLFMIHPRFWLANI